MPGCQSFLIEFMHLRTAANSGTGLKPHSAYGVPGCHEHHAEAHQIGHESFARKYDLDLDAIAAELVRRSPDVRMRLSLMEEEIAAEPLRVGPRDAAGRAAIRPEALPEATRELPAAAQPYRLAGNLSRISRLIPYEGFVS